MRDPYYVYGGLQDNGTWGGPSMSREGMILTDFWFNFNGGDGFHTQNDPTDWRIVYSESQGGSANRTNVETREARSIQPRPNNVLNYKDFYPETPAPTGPTAQGGQRGGQRAGAGQQAAQGQRGGQQVAAGQRGGAGQAATPESGFAQMGPGGVRSPFRFNWSTPIYLSPHNPSIVYMGGQHLFRSEDRGDHWMIISPDLTTNDKTKFGARDAGT
jgi:hypothetical protein